MIDMTIWLKSREQAERIQSHCEQYIDWECQIKETGDDSFKAMITISADPSELAFAQLAKLAKQY